MNSPARAGRKPLPKYPAEVAQKVHRNETGFSAVNKTRHRAARSSKPAVRIAHASPRSVGFALRISSQTPPQSIPRTEKYRRMIARTAAITALTVFQENGRAGTVTPVSAV